MAGSPARDAQCVLCKAWYERNECVSSYSPDVNNRDRWVQFTTPHRIGIARLLTPPESALVGNQCTWAYEDVLQLYRVRGGSSVPTFVPLTRKFNLLFCS